MCIPIKRMQPVQITIYELSTPLLKAGLQNMTRAESSEYL